MAKQEFYIDRFLCPIEHEIEFDNYGLATRSDIFSGNMCFISEKDFCEKMERAVIISESGMGKTSLLRNLKEKYLGSDAKIFELSQYRSSPAELRDSIVRFIEEFRNAYQDGNKKPFIMLDALDEAEMLSGELSRYLSEDIKLDDIRLIITSRNRENAAYLIEKLGLAQETEKHDTHDTKIGVYKLTPPSFRDVEAYVREIGENPENFFIAVENKSVTEMCANPLGLEFLLQSYKEEGFAEKSIADIWRRGLERMCDKSNAPSARPKSDFSPTEKMDCACWIAMTMALQNKMSIYSGVESETPNDGIHSSELEYDKFSGALILETIQDTSLFTHEPSALKSSFAHTTFFEHCAAMGIKKFVNKRSRSRLLLRNDGEEFLRKFYGIVSKLALIDEEFRSAILDKQPNLLLKFRDTANSTEPEKLCEKLINYYTPDKYNAERWGRYSRFSTIDNKNRVCAYLITTLECEEIINTRLELIIDIARDCECHDFADKFVDIVLGKIQAADDAYNVKIGALRAIAYLNPNFQK